MILTTAFPRVAISTRALPMVGSLALTARSSTVTSLGNCDDINGELVHGRLPRQL